VLGNGDIVRTGFRHVPESKISYIYRHGLGPSLDGLFFQSNYGIVTSAGFDLIPARAHHRAMVVSARREEDLEDLVDALSRLRKQNIIQTVVHVGNRNRSSITLTPLVYSFLVEQGHPDNENTKALADSIVEREGFGPWGAVAGLFGTRRQIRCMQEEIRRALRGLADVRFLGDAGIARGRAVLSRFSFLDVCRRKRAVLHAVEALYGLSKGIPTDAALKSVSWPIGVLPGSGGTDLDQGRGGILYCVPFIPSSGTRAREVVRRTEEVFGAHGFTPYITLNLVDGKAMEGVINLAFDREDRGRATEAHACVEELLLRFMKDGYLPYRVGVQTMEKILDEKDPYWKVVRDLKQVFDPNNIIAPGRYNLV
jgi:4-cresol dehydrogenase (hydroxylating)